MKLQDYVTQDELRRLLSSLVVFLVAAGIFGLFGFIVIPGLRNANKPEIATPVPGVALETGWLDPTEYLPTRSFEIPPLRPEDVLSPTPELLERGKAVYEKSCGQCHGAEGLGNGPSAAALKPAPRNFRDREGWKNGFDRYGIFQTLAEGIAGSSMAPYDYLRRQDRMGLVHYVRKLGGIEETSETSARKLAELLESAGEVVPNKIPVSMAMARLEEESPDVPPIAMPPADDASPGAALLRRAIQNPARAAIALERAEGWRDDESQLARIAVRGAPSNGFAPQIVGFGPREWRLLREALITTGGR